MTDRVSDAGSLGEYKDANQTYPHVDSLSQPLHSPIGDQAPVYATYDKHELATQYVLTKITELRFVEIYKICNPLHRSNLKNLQKTPYKCDDFEQFFNI